MPVRAMPNPTAYSMPQRRRSLAGDVPVGRADPQGCEFRANVAVGLFGPLLVPRRQVTSRRAGRPAASTRSLQLVGGSGVAGLGWRARPAGRGGAGRGGVTGSASAGQALVESLTARSSRSRVRPGRAGRRWCRRSGVRGDDRGPVPGRDEAADHFHRRPPLRAVALGRHPTSRPTAAKPAASTPIQRQPLQHSADTPTQEESTSWSRREIPVSRGATPCRSPPPGRR